MFYNGLAMHSNFNDLKTKTMTAKEYLLDIGFDDAHLPELFNNDDKSYYQITELMEEYHQAKLKLLGIGGVVGSTLIEVENAYIEDADTVERGDIYDVTGRVSKCWITENDFDKVKCTNS